MKKINPDSFVVEEVLAAGGIKLTDEPKKDKKSPGKEEVKSPKKDKKNKKSEGKGAKTKDDALYNEGLSDVEDLVLEFISTESDESSDKEVTEEVTKDEEDRDGFFEKVLVTAGFTKPIALRRLLGENTFNEFINWANDKNIKLPKKYAELTSTDSDKESKKDKSGKDSKKDKKKSKKDKSDKDEKKKSKKDKSEKDSKKDKKSKKDKSEKDSKKDKKSKKDKSDKDKKKSKKKGKGKEEKIKVASEFSKAITIPKEDVDVSKIDVDMKTDYSKFKLVGYDD